MIRQCAPTFCSFNHHKYIHDLLVCWIVTQNKAYEHSRWTQQMKEKTRVKRQQVILSRRGTHALINHKGTRVNKYNVFIPIDSNRK